MQINLSPALVAIAAYQRPVTCRYGVIQLPARWLRVIFCALWGIQEETIFPLFGVSSLFGVSFSIPNYLHWERCCP